MPADILVYLKENTNSIGIIRNLKEYKKFIGGIIDE